LPAASLTRIIASVAKSSGNPDTSQRLRESEARLRAIVETAVDGIITIDEKGTVESLNPAAERIFGYAAAEVIGRNISMLMPSPYHEEHDQYLRNYMETGVRRIIGIGREVRGRRKDGSTFPMEIAVSELHVDDGRRFTGIVRDISIRKRLEREIMEVSARERRRIGQDLHDGLGQELTGIAFRVSSLQEDLAARELPEADDAGRIADLVNQAIRHARALVKGLCPVEGGPEGLSVSMNDLANTVRHAYGRSCTYEGDDRVTVADHTLGTHLYYIASEAVNNALKHARAEHIRIRLMPEGDRYGVIEIEDDGVGFDLNQSRDSGRGLKIMHYRARMIGAALEVAPGARCGTVVRCRFETSPPKVDAS